MPAMVFLCPSDLTSEPFEVTDATRTGLAIASPSSYAASVGGDETDAATGPNDDGLGRGVMFRTAASAWPTSPTEPVRRLSSWNAPGRRQAGCGLAR